MEYNGISVLLSSYVACECLYFKTTFSDGNTDSTKYNTLSSTKYFAVFGNFLVHLPLPFVILDFAVQELNSNYVDTSEDMLSELLPFFFCRYTALERYLDKRLLNFCKSLCFFFE